MARRLTAALIVSVLSAGTLVAADPPRPASEPIKVMPRPVDSGKLPGGALVIPNSDAKEGLKRTDAVVLSAEEYRKLLDTIEQLKKQVNPDKPEIPSVCRLSGRIELRGQQDVAKIQATFEFRTTTPRAVITLGCRKAGAIGATIDDGQLPLLQNGDDGYTVVVETPGTHKVVLELEASVAARGASGNERGFTLHLPGSPITLIDQFEFPAAVTRVRLGRLAPATAAMNPPQNLSAPTLQKPAAGAPGVVLGQVEGIELYWDNPTPQKSADPLPVAEAAVAVRLDETNITTTTRLTLKTIRGRMNEWKIQAPANASVTVESGDPETMPTLARGKEEKGSWLVQVHDPRQDEVTLLIEQQVPRKGPVAVGPVVVPGAFRQQGTISIFAPSQLRPLVSRLRPDVSRQAAPEDANAPDAVYAFGSRSLNAGAQNTPWLFLDAETLRGEVQTQTTQTLTLADGGWRLVLEIRANPIRTEIDHLDLDIPSELEGLQASPPALVAGLESVPTSSPQRWQLRLVRPRRTEFSCKIEGFFPARSGANQASFILPRVLQTQDRDGRVQVYVPEGLKVRGQVHEWDRDRVSESSRPLTTNLANAAAGAGATTSRTPAQIDLAWSPVQIQWQMESLVDVTLGERQAHIRQRLTFPPASSTRNLVLRPTTGVAPMAFRVLEGATLASSGMEWVLAIPPETGGVQVVSVSYAVPLRVREQPAVGPVADLGLLWPISATQCDTRVRFSSAPAVHLQPKLAGGPWEVLPLEAVAGQETLPQLVLQGSGTLLPLTLQLSEWSGLPPPPLNVDRVFAQVLLGDNAPSSYRIRLFVRSANAPFLEMEMPESPAAIGLEAWLNGNRLDSLPPSVAANIVRFPLEEGKDQLLELRYHLSSPSDGRLHWTSAITPPTLRGSVLIGAARWQIIAPEDGVLLLDGSPLQTECIWSFRRVLPERRPAFSTAQLETWLRTGADPQALDEGSSQGTTLEARSSNLNSFGLARIPRVVWLLGCSIIVLLLGLFMALLGRMPRWFWAALVSALVAAGAWVLLATESALTFLAAAPPGWLVLALALTLLWWLRRRYQRKVVFLPGFARSEPNSALARPVGSNHRQREPSTAEVRPAS
ncbi:MAG TPA: hypothetical protein VKS79_16665 [Gemmataceae bacterium]|nr:hypothetical protein [Gemmataceae bacterium]